MYADSFNGLDLTGIYRVAVANGYHLPPIKSSFLTCQYLADVLQRRVHCLKKADVRLASCNKRPTIAVLMEAVRVVERDKRINLGIKARGPFPPSYWLLDIVSTYDPKH